MIGERSIRRLLALLLTLSLLSAAAMRCGREGGIESAPVPRAVSSETAGGVVVEGRYYGVRGDAPPGIVCLADTADPPGEWDAVAQRTQQAGIACLVIDLRPSQEHKGGRGLRPDAFEAIAAGERMLAEQGTAQDRLGIIGAGPGACLALAYAANDADVAALVLLSPSLLAEGVDAQQEVAVYGRRPVLFLACEGDSFGSRASRVLKETAAGLSQLHIYQGTAAGLDVLTTSLSATEQAVAWLTAVL